MKKNKKITGTGMFDCEGKDIHEGDILLSNFKLIRIKDNTTPYGTYKGNEWWVKKTMYEYARRK